MTVIADQAVFSDRRQYLKHAAGPNARVAAAFLLLDAIAAIAFAAGLANAIAAVPAGIGRMMPWVSLAFVAAILRGGAVIGATRAGAAHANYAKTALRDRIVAAALRQAPGGLLTTGVLMNAVVDEVEAIDGYVARFLPARHAAAIAPLLVLAATAYASPVAAGILVLTLLPFILAMALTGGAAADQSRQQFEALSRLSGLFADRLRALPVVTAFNAEEHETARIAEAAEEIAHRTLKVLGIAFLSSGALEFFAALSVALVAVYAGFNLLGLLPFPAPEKLDLARAFFILALAPEFYAPMRRLAAAYHDRQAAETAADRLMLVGQVSASGASRQPISSPRAPTICYDRVGIRYPGAEQSAVVSFCLNVASGETIALLGPSGSGKTSLLHLLLGLAPLTQGAVRIDEVDIAEAGPVAGLAAWVGQSPLIVPGTIRENVALSRPQATSSEILAAVRAAGLGPALLRRRYGLDDRLDERGGGLSGGERRRVALARALLKHAPLLLLDEPTAHLDPSAELELIQTIRQATRGRTTLIATHSEALAAIADRIIRLEPSP